MALPQARGLAGAEWYKAPIDLEDWIRPARLIWRWLKRRTRHRKRKHRPKDWELARELNRCRRTIQRGLWYLEFVCKVIVRRRVQGHMGHDSFREIEVILPLQGDEKQAEARPKSKGDAKAAPAPAEAPKPAEAPPPAPEPTETPGERAAALAAIREQVARERAAARTAPPAPAHEPPSRPPAAIKGIPAADPKFLEVKERMGEPLTPSERAALEAARRERGP